MQVRITRTIPVYRSSRDNGVFLQWVVDNPPSSDMSFSLERSGSPEGPFDAVVSNLQSYHFFDNIRQPRIPGPGEVYENLNLLSLWRSIYYKVTATSGASTATVIKEVEANLPRKQLLLQRKILRDELIAFKKLNGIELAVLKRKHWGARCAVCFDALTKKVLNSKCTRCYGTGFVDGYFAPVRVWGRMGATNIQTQITPHGNTDIGKHRVILLDYPQIEVYDVIVDLWMNKRFVVETAHATELRTVMVHQELTVSELARDSIEYQIPVNSETSPMIY